jgi:hypothetical protein
MVTRAGHSVSAVSRLGAGVRQAGCLRADGGGNLADDRGLDGPAGQGGQANGRVFEDHVDYRGYVADDLACVDGQADAANQRITDALGTTEPAPGPGDEGDAGSKPAA